MIKFRTQPCTMQSLMQFIILSMLGCVFQTVTPLEPITREFEGLDMASGQVVQGYPVLHPITGLPFTLPRGNGISEVTGGHAMIIPVHQGGAPMTKNTHDSGLQETSHLSKGIVGHDSTSISRHVRHRKGKASRPIDLQLRAMDQNRFQAQSVDSSGLSATTARSDGSKTLNPMAPVFEPESMPNDLRHLREDNHWWHRHAGSSSSSTGSTEDELIRARSHSPVSIDTWEDPMDLEFYNSFVRESETPKMKSKDDDQQLSTMKESIAEPSKKPNVGEAPQTYLNTKGNKESMDAETINLNHLGLETQSTQGSPGKQEIVHEDQSDDKELEGDLPRVEEAQKIPKKRNPGARKRRRLRAKQLKEAEKSSTDQTEEHVMDDIELDPQNQIEFDIRPDSEKQSSIKNHVEFDKERKDIGDNESRPSSPPILSTRYEGNSADAVPRNRDLERLSADVLHPTSPRFEKLDDVISDPLQSKEIPASGHPIEESEEPVRSKQTVTHEDDENSEVAQKQTLVEPFGHEIHVPHTSVNRDAFKEELQSTSNAHLLPIANHDALNVKPVLDIDDHIPLGAKTSTLKYLPETEQEWQRAWDELTYRLIENRKTRQSRVSRASKGLVDASKPIHIDHPPSSPDGISDSEIDWSIMYDTVPTHPTKSNDKDSTHPVYSQAEHDQSVIHEQAGPQQLEKSSRSSVESYGSLWSLLDPIWSNSQISKRVQQILEWLKPFKNRAMTNKEFNSGIQALTKHQVKSFRF